jgi:hypothetical protein
MSVREQERRQKDAEKRIEVQMRRADRQVLGTILARQEEATRRAEQIVRRIEKGDVQPHPLPSLREDSMGSMESMRSTESAETVSGVTGEAQPEGMKKGMPLQGVMRYDPASAEEDLAQRVTEDTGSGGDPHAHNERKGGKMAVDTGAGGT